MNGKRPGGWVALAWRYWRDPKILAVSAEAELLWLHALCAVGEGESDGKVQSQMLKALCTKGRRSPRALAGELVRAGLWLETDDGYAFPLDTWSRWQETAEQRVAARARNADRQARWRALLRVTNGVTNPVTNGDVTALVTRHQAQGQGGSPYGLPPPCPPLTESDLFTDDDGRLFVRPSEDR